MTVSQLIDKLKQLDPDKPVVIENRYDNESEVTEVREVTGNYWDSEANKHVQKTCVYLDWSRLD